MQKHNDLRKPMAPFINDLDDIKVPLKPDGTPLYDEPQASEEDSDLGPVLPTALAQRMLKQILCGSVFVIAGITMMIVTKNLSFAVGIAVGLYFFALAFMTRRDFKHGKIVEKALLCSIATNGKSSSRVVMVDTETPPNYYEYTVSIGKNNEFIQNAVYVVYTHIDRPKELLAWMLV